MLVYSLPLHLTQYYLFIQLKTCLCTNSGLTKLVDPVKETDSSSAPE